MCKIALEEKKNVGQRTSACWGSNRRRKTQSSYDEETMSYRVKRTNSLRENLIGQSKLSKCKFRILTNNPVLLHERLLSWYGVATNLKYFEFSLSQTNEVKSQVVNEIRISILWLKTWWLIQVQLEKNRLKKTRTMSHYRLLSLNKLIKKWWFYT